MVTTSALVAAAWLLVAVLITAATLIAAWLLVAVLVTAWRAWVGVARATLLVAVLIATGGGRYARTRTAWATRTALLRLLWRHLLLGLGLHLGDVSGDLLLDALDLLKRIGLVLLLDMTGEVAVEVDAVNALS